MSTEVKNLDPQPLWSSFADLNAVPRASKKEAAVIAFMQKFGQSLGLPVHTDETGNVIIRKPATPGMEKRRTVILQSHLDMVHQKNADTSFNFDTMGINMFVDGDWVRARGTTLGADNGIGVSAIMALLASEDIPHPPLEALFTIDEETGMTGALGLKGGLLEGRLLLNLDTEDDRELTIGCAGGVDVTATGTFRQGRDGGQGYVISIKGLTGGHSGMDIHLGRGNAYKLMAGLLGTAEAEFGAALVSFDGGGLRNAIPREAVAEILVPEDAEEEFLLWLGNEVLDLKRAYAGTDPGFTVSCQATETAELPLHPHDQRNILAALNACPNGVYRMSPDMPGLVQTSNNLARVLVKNGTFTFQCLTRSSVEAEKKELAENIGTVFSRCGSKSVFSGSYPGWTPAPESDLVHLMSKVYREQFGDEPHVNACHAGLECGILSTHYPGMQMISFGPNIRGAHSPDECVQISSVQKFWNYLLKVLSRIPESD